MASQLDMLWVERRDFGYVVPLSPALHSTASSHRLHYSAYRFDDDPHGLMRLITTELSDLSLPPKDPSSKQRLYKKEVDASSGKYLWGEVALINFPHIALKILPVDSRYATNYLPGTLEALAFDKLLEASSTSD